MPEERKPDLLRTPAAAPAPAPAPHPAVAPVKDEPEVTNETIVGGRYGVPGQPGKFVNAEGKPIDANGNPIKEEQG